MRTTSFRRLSSRNALPHPFPSLAEIKTPKRESPFSGGRRCGDSCVFGWGFWQRDTPDVSQPDFQPGVSHSACFSGIWGCLCALPNRSPNEAAVALHLTAQQRCTRPRDRAGFQTGLVILSYTPVIKHRLRLLDHHLPKKIPSFLFSTC